MGFGFSLFGFPLLVLATVWLLILFFIYKKKIVLFILVGMWGLVIALFFFVSLAGHYSRPIRLAKEDIVGEYRIDADFYPGTNASWQYDHFKFLITGDDSIVFVVMDEKEIPESVYRHKIQYSDGPPVLWSISADTTHHIIEHGPTLYRSHSRFYYVFRSEKFGNMFFRKTER